MDNKELRPKTKKGLTPLETVVLSETGNVNFTKNRLLGAEEKAFRQAKKLSSKP